MIFWRTLFLILTSVAVGLAVGTYLGADVTAVDSQLVLLIAGIAGGVCLLATIIFAVLIARYNKARLNLKVSLQKKDVVLQAGVEYVVKNLYITFCILV